MPDWPQSSGQMAMCIRQHDWSATPLGPIADWPERLQAVVELVLASPLVASVAVGPDRRLIYNDAAARLYGARHPHVLGRPLADAFPDSYPAVAPLYDRVFAGEPVQVTAQPLAVGDGPVDEVFDAWLTPVRDAAGTVIGAHMIGLEIGDRFRADAALRASEERQAFLLRLSDALRPLSDPETIQAEAMRLLGEQLGVSRAQYYIADETGEYLSSTGGYTDGVPAAVGRFRLIEFGQYAYDGFHAGKTQVVADAATDARISEAVLASYQAVGFLAYIGVPFLQRGRLLGTVAVHQAEPRRWTQAERLLVEETAERAGIAIEQARVERALRESEERQAFLLTLSDTLRPLTEPGEIERAATRLLGEHLRADRCFLSPVYEDGSGMCVREEYLRTDASSVLGDYTFAQFGDFVGPELHAGHILAVEDVSALASLRPAERESYATVGIGAYLLIPLIRAGRLAAFLTINHRTPHCWSNADQAIARQTADRLWTARERARAEAEVRESERLRRVALAGGRMGSWRWHRGDDLIQGDEQFMALWGLPPRDAPLSLATFTARMSEQGAADIAEIVERAVSAEEEFSGSLEIVAGPTAGSWIQWQGRAAIDDPSVLYGVTFGITERRAAEARLRESERQQQVLIEGVPQLVWRGVGEGEWTWASPQWTEFTGQAEADCHGWGWLDPVHPDDRARVRDAWAGASKHGEFHANYRLRQAATGRFRWFQTSAAPVRDEDGVIVEWLGTSTDVDDLREAQNRQQVLLAELQHRVRNILAIIRSIMRRSLDGEQSLRDYAQHLEGRLSALARTQVLLTRRIDARVDLEDLVRDELVAQAADEARVTLAGPEVALPPKAAEVLALAIHELATNSLKYGATGDSQATLTIEWRTERRGDDRWLVIVWHERGVATAAGGPRHSGFGTELVTQRVPYELRGEGSLDFRPGGIVCTIAFPLRDGTSVLETGGVAPGGGETR